MLGTSGDQFNNFACETVARVTGDKHNGWGIALITSSNPGVAGELVRGVEVLLDSQGAVSIVPSRWLPGRKSDVPAVAPIGPIRARSFHPLQFNSLVVLLRDGRKLAAFVNGVEACPELSLPYTMEPAMLQLASAGGASEHTRLEFKSYAVFAMSKTSAAAK